MIVFCTSASKAVNIILSFFQLVFLGVIGFIWTNSITVQNKQYVSISGLWHSNALLLYNIQLAEDIKRKGRGKFDWTQCLDESERQQVNCEPESGLWLGIFVHIIGIRHGKKPSFFLFQFKYNYVQEMIKCIQIFIRSFQYTIFQRLIQLIHKYTEFFFDIHFHNVTLWQYLT